MTQGQFSEEFFKSYKNYVKYLQPHPGFEPGSSY